MRIVWEHLKLVPQRDKSYLSPVFALFMVWMTVLTGSVQLLLLIPFAMVPSFAGMYCDIAARPVSFCLPGYRDQARTLILIGAALNGMAFTAFSVSIFQLDEWNWPFAGWIAFIGFLVGFAFTLLSAGPHYGLLVLSPVVRRVFSIPGVIGILIILAGVIGYPWLIWPVTLLTSVWICIFAWYRLDNAHDVARAHRMTTEDAIAKRAKAGRARMAPGWIHDFFLAQILRHHPLGTWRYIWASFYRTFGPLLFSWRRVLVGAFLLSLLLLRPVAEVTFVLMGFAATLVDLPVTSSMLLPAGRRERFLATVVVTLALSLLLVVVATATVCFSGMIVMPLGLHARSLGTSLHRVWLACTLVPWVCAWRLRGCGRSRTGNEISTFLYEVVMLIFPTLVLFTCDWPAQPRYLLFGAVGASGWALFLAVLQYACTRGDLVGPKPLKGGQL